MGNIYDGLAKTPLYYALSIEVFAEPVQAGELLFTRPSFMKNLIQLALFFILLLSSIALPRAAFADDALTKTRQIEGLENIPYGKILTELIPIGYSGYEYLHYDVSWTGGLKVGEVTLRIEKIPAGKQQEKRENPYQIEVYVSTKGGVVEAFYSIRDRHITLLDGEEKLPYLAEMWQKEGKNYRAHRKYIFKQKEHRVIYSKNGRQEGDYKLKDTTNNEFSAFLNSRLMAFEVGKPFIVPTFADKKRIEVKVTPIKKERLKTIFGEVETFALMPLMTFKGLYEKQGDTVIWYTADECRIPVKVNSKIVIGSLTAKLAGYKNKKCQRYNGKEKK